MNLIVLNFLLRPSGLKCFGRKKEKEEKQVTILKEFEDSGKDIDEEEDIEIKDDDSDFQSTTIDLLLTNIFDLLGSGKLYVLHIIFAINIFSCCLLNLYTKCVRFHVDLL